MSKRFLQQSVAVLSLLLALLIVVPASAQTNRERGEAQTQAPRAEGHLNNARLEACQNRSANIVTLMSRLTQKAEQTIVTLDAITERLKQYYSTQGLSSPDYPTLVDNVVNKKAAVLDLLANVKQSANAFDCSGDNPQGTASSFATNFRQLQQALQDYRASIKDLLVAIKQAAREAANE
jgi:hypothetical protein